MSGEILSDLLWAALAVGLARARFTVHVRGISIKVRGHSWTISILYGVAFATVWVLEDMHLLTRLVSAVAGGGILLAYLFAPFDDDDDDHRGRRRRVRSALKRAREWMARGIPAARPVPA